MENIKKQSARKKKEDISDLGFGSQVTQNSEIRLLNRDGSFNVERVGLPPLESLHFYHSLLTMPWFRFHAVMALAYVFLNILFAALYLMSDGLNSKQGLENSLFHKFQDAFFFSIQTFTTVGYGYLTPNGLAGNIIASIDAFVGLMAFAFATGLLFARFSRPTVDILFSNKAIIAPYNDIKGFMFRLANTRKGQLLDIKIKVLFSEMTGPKNNRKRKFQLLNLEREAVVFLPLYLTVVHPIDEGSPLSNRTSEDLQKANAEFLIIVSAFNETFSQTVHKRTSYKWHELAWNVKFRSLFQEESGVVKVDLSGLHDYDPVTLQE